MNRQPAEPWLERALVLLDKSAASMDAVTRLHLAQARNAALAQHTDHHHAWALGGSFVGVALALLLLATGIGQRHDAALVPDAGVQSTDADADPGGVDAIDFYENLDFYVWLDAEQQERDD